MTSRSKRALSYATVAWFALALVGDPVATIQGHNHESLSHDRLLLDGFIHGFAFATFLVLAAFWLAASWMEGDIAKREAMAARAGKGGVTR